LPASRPAWSVSGAWPTPFPPARSWPGSLVSRGIADEILPTCRELGIGVTAYGVLSRGLLSGHWSKQRADALVPHDFRAAAPRFTGENLYRNLALVETLRGLADEKGATAAQLAIAWVLSRGDDIVPLVGARRRDRLAEALGALELELTADDLARIEGAIPAGAPAGERYHTQQMALLDSERGWARALVRENALTREQILEAAENVLRRYGPAKANVVDVARALGVSHGSVYRHFTSKAALRDAVTERWLESISFPLEAVAREDGPAAERLQRWLDLLVRSSGRRLWTTPSSSPPTSSSRPRHAESSMRTSTRSSASSPGSSAMGSRAASSR
jgi:Aldo/keto reductase family/Bacterial regulatory proteins, tetR family